MTRLLSFRPAVVGVVALLAVGCSDYASVRGRVHYPDGSPLDTGLVVCEPSEGQYAGKMTARGVIQRDGTFRLGIDRANEGVPPGKYKVLVTGRYQSVEELQTEPLVVDPRYNSFEKSGLTLDVSPGGGELDITINKGPTPRKAAGHKGKR